VIRCLKKKGGILWFLHNWKAEGLYASGLFAVDQNGKYIPISEILNTSFRQNISSFRSGSISGVHKREPSG